MPELAVSTHPAGPAVPALIAGAGDRAAWRFLEFFTVNIRNANMRAAYGRAAAAFLRWCEARGIRRLQDVQPVHVLPISSSCRPNAPRRPSSNIWPVSGCSLTGW
jgi:hypothetical protein